MKTRLHDDFMAESFRKDPAYDILEDGEPAELLIALRQMSKAFGGMGEVARQAGVNANTLYRTLSEQGNPQVSTLAAILRSMGMRLAVQPLNTPAGSGQSSVAAAAA